MTARTFLRKATVATKETAKLATASVVSVVTATTILKTIKKPSETDVAVTALMGGTMGVATYSVLDAVDSIVTESVERVKDA